jgi:putative membrane protein
MTGPASAATDPPTDGEGWRRLDARMIWADGLRVLLSLTPAAIALLIVGVEPGPGTLWPVLMVAVWGTGGACADVLRWITTRYRVTEEHLERRTGLFVRTFRSIRRDRIRSVDADARLLQRIVGLRRVKVGAGQVNTAMEQALTLNAVSRDAAAGLHRRLLVERHAVPQRPGTATATAERRGTGETEVFAGLRWWWICYNMVNIWAFVMAAGLLWGGYFGLTLFGLDPVGVLGSLADWDALGPARTIALAAAATGALGILGLGCTFVTEYAHFRLTRVPGEHGTLLRTTQGLFKTREINRDDTRLRGLALSEPLLWRWMRMTDTTVITTGLSMWGMSATILPRGPRSVARRVAAAVLDTPDSPLEAPLRRHPRAALRRRTCWALLVTGALAGLLAHLGAHTALSGRLWWLSAAALLIPALGLAWAGYRALGHTFAGEYVVLRSGAVSRTTAALQRRAVSGVRIRQSLFQRRLGLATVSLSTAAGWGGYSAVDLAAGEAVDFAARALPGHLMDACRPGPPPAAGPPGRPPPP